MRGFCFSTSGMTHIWGASPQWAADRAESNSQRQLHYSKVGWGGSRSRNTDRMNKNRIKGQSTRGEEATDAYARYSVKSVHGRFSLLCVKATSLILRSIDKESAAEQSVSRESAVAIVPPSKQHQREGPNPAWATTCISEHIATEQKILKCMKVRLKEGTRSNIPEKTHYITLSSAMGWQCINFIPEIIQT